MYLYKITNLVNDKIYIGQTIRENPNKRWYEHCYQKGPGVDSAIKKYGKGAFSFEVIGKFPSEAELNLFERYYIKKYNSMVPKGYNILEGGKNRKMPLEVRRKLSIARKGQKNRCSPVVGINEKTGTSWFFSNAKEAEKHGFLGSKIIACCRGKRKAHGLHFWKYFKELGV